jgi:hypothetical protein
MIPFNVMGKNIYDRVNIKIELLKEGTPLMWLFRVNSLQ